MNCENNAASSGFRIILPSPVKKALEILQNAGYEAYIVGGCVRDSLLKKQPDDWDITTSALPQQIKQCFIEYPIYETGMQHGTLTVMIDDMPMEITTFRVDGKYLDSRHPDKVFFTNRLEEDLKRRDFTINAMAYNEEQGLCDPFCGLQDLSCGIIRCVGDPKARFGEDALHILRAVRFASVLSFRIEPFTQKAIHVQKELLQRVSVERIAKEFEKWLMGNRVEETLLEFSDVLAVFIPEIVPSIGFWQYNPYHDRDVFSHIARSVSLTEKKRVVRLSLFFHDIGKPACSSFDEQGQGHFYNHAKKSAELAGQILKRLHYDNATVKTVETLIRYHDNPFIAEPKAVRRLLNRLGEENVRRLVAIKRADIWAQSADYLGRLDLLDRFEELLQEQLDQDVCVDLASLAVKGDDLIAIGVPKGKEIGLLLQYLLDLVLDGKVQNKKEALLKEIKRKRPYYE